MGVRTNRVVYYKFYSQNAGGLEINSNKWGIRTNRCSYKWGPTVRRRGTREGG